MEIPVQNTPTSYTPLSQPHTPHPQLHDPYTPSKALGNVQVSDS